jgi:type II secretory pathway pseudopilin PulG
MSRPNLQKGAGRIVPLAIVAVVLAAGYVASYLYTGNEKDMLAVETRGAQMITALASYRRANGEYPDTLNKLVPEYARAVNQCPNGEQMGYVPSASSYALSCREVVFKKNPYTYSSQTRSWSG